MKMLKSIILLVAVLISFFHCTKSNYDAALIGTWEWTGHACDNKGKCEKEIITDEGSRETFTKDGMYLSKRARNNYIVKNKMIYLASDKDEFNTAYAEIISINRDVMLLRFNKDIRRYNRTGGD